MAKNGPEHARKVEVFRKEVEASLDLRIAQYENEAFEWEGSLRKMRGKIVAEIMNNSLEDLELTQEELKIVYEGLKEDLEKVDVKNFNQFMNFIGFAGVSIDKYANGEEAGAIFYTVDGSVLRKSSGNGKARKHVTYGDDGRALYESSIGGGKIPSAFMYDSKGDKLGVFSYEKARDPAMTPEKYLDKLARELNTLEKLAVFIKRVGMRYTSDSGKPGVGGADLGASVKSDEPRVNMNPGAAADYWQTASQTVQRTHNGRMLGDCDDYAFLAKDILERQGKRPQIANVGQHAACIWVEKKGQKYNVYTLCTYGLDKAEGFDSLRAAVAKVTSKYGANFKAHYGEKFNFDYLFVLKAPTEEGGDIDIMRPIECIADKEAQLFYEESRNYKRGDAHRIDACVLLCMKYPENIEYFHNLEIKMYYMESEQKIKVWEHVVFNKNLLNEKDYTLLFNLYVKTGKVKELEKLCRHTMEKMPRFRKAYDNLLNFYIGKGMDIKSAEMRSLIQREFGRR